MAIGGGGAAIGIEGELQLVEVLVEEGQGQPAVDGRGAIHIEAVRSRAVVRSGGVRPSRGGAFHMTAQTGIEGSRGGIGGSILEAIDPRQRVAVDGHTSGAEADAACQTGVVIAANGTHRSVIGGVGGEVGDGGRIGRNQVGSCHTGGVSEGHFPFGGGAHLEPRQDNLVSPGHCRQVIDTRASGQIVHHHIVDTAGVIRRIGVLPLERQTGGAGGYLRKREFHFEANAGSHQPIVATMIGGSGRGIVGNRNESGGVVGSDITHMQNAISGTAGFGAHPERKL